MKKVFILGNPRSGTSLLRIMLNCHSKIAAPSECGFMQWWYKKYGKWSEVSYESEEFSTFIEDLFTSRKIATWKLNKNNLRQFLVQKRPENYEELTESIYQYWAIQTGKKPEILIDKNNYYIHHLEEIDEIWPDACYILLVRDGRDVACSYKKIKELETKSPYKPDLPDRIEEIAKEWKTNNENIIHFLEGIEPDRFITIKYEQLILNCSETLTKLCRFLNLEFDPQMLNYYGENKKRKIEPVATLDWKKKTLKKPDKDNIGKYKDELKADEISTFNNISGEMLKRFKYLI